MSILLFLAFFVGGQVILYFTSILNLYFEYFSWLSAIYFYFFPIFVSPQIAAADQKHCKSMYQLLRSHLLNLETWSDDSDAVLSKLNNVLMPEIQQFSNNIYPAIYQMENKLKIIDPKGEGSAAITSYTTNGILLVDKLFEKAGQNLAQSYHDAVREFTIRINPRTTDDLRNPLRLPVYSIKTDFMRLCKQGFDIIQMGVDAVKDTIHRIHETFNTDLQHIASAPNGFIPIISPYLLGGLFIDFNDKKFKNETKNFGEYIIGIYTNVLKETMSNANDQIDVAGHSLELFLNETNIIDDGQRTELRDKMRVKAADSRVDIDDLLVKAQNEFKTNIPEVYDEETMPHWSMSTIGQETVDGFATKINEIATEAINDFINLFESLLDFTS